MSRGQASTNLKLNPVRMQHAEDVEREALKKGDSLLLAEAWYLYGKTYIFAGDYQKAQNYFLKALRIHEPRGDSFALSRLYVRFSEIEDRLGHSEKALRYAILSLEIAQRLQSDKALIRAYGAVGHVYETRWAGALAGNPARYEKILFYYRQRESLCYKLKDSMGVAEVSREIGVLMANVENPQAIFYLEKALDLFTRYNKDGIRVGTMSSLASAYLIFNKPKPAFQTLLNAEALYDRKKLNEYDIRLDLEKQFVRYYEKTNQWKKAFERLRRLNQLERIQLLADRQGAISRLSVEYETEKNEALLKAQKSEINLNAKNLAVQQQLTIIVGFFFLAATGLSVVFFRLYRKKQRISRRNAELVKEQNHRVKNNLQVVSSLLSLQAKRLTDKAARKAIEESRLRVQSMAIIHQRLYDGDKLAEVNLDDFIRELVQGVLRSFGYSTVRTNLSIDDVLLSADKAVPLGLILNELTTNACKYAFPDSADPELSISCRLHNKRLKINVMDNGPGMNRTEWIDGHGQKRDDEIITIRKTSFGMQLIQSQAEQLYGTYRFTADDKGVMFTMEFNV